MALAPFFRNAHPDRLDEHLNTLVVAVNNVVVSLQQGGLGVFPLATAQLMQGLADPASIGYDPNYLVASNIPPSVPYSKVYVGWNSAGYVLANGALYSFVQAQLGLTASQMLTFYQSCSQYPVSP